MWRRRCQRDGRRTRRRTTENLLVGLHVEEKIMIAGKVHPEDRDGDQSQIEKPLKTAGTKT